MLEGSCLCGRVNYQVKGPQKTMYYCHCSICRKASGSSFATNMLVAAEDFALRSGESFVKGYESSPGEIRYFCSECGSQLFFRGASLEGLVSVRCGSLNQDPGIRPSEHIFTGSKAPWQDILDDLPQFPDGPP